MSGFVNLKNSIWQNWHVVGFSYGWHKYSLTFKIKFIRIVFEWQFIRYQKKKITCIYRKRKITFRWSKWQGNKGHSRDHFQQNFIFELVRIQGQQTILYFLSLQVIYLIRFVDLQTGIRFLKRSKLKPWNILSSKLSWNDNIED